MKNVSISNQRIHFKHPVFIKVFNQDEFCNKLKLQLLKKLKIYDDEGNVAIRTIPKKSYLDVSLVHILKTEKGIGVITFIKTPWINGMYFYLQGETHISRIVDTTFEKISKTIEGSSFSAFTKK